MSEGERLRAAVVGCGGAGVYNHIAWYATHPGVELAGLVDTDPERAANAAAQWGGRPYQDLGTMLERERPRLVSIATPVHLHAAHTVRCLAAGCDVLCEKPMAPTPADCRRMIDAASASGRMLGIALDKRFSEEFRLARKLIRDGEIGEPLFVRIHWVATVEWSGFRTRRYTGGGVFQDVGSHFLDLIPWTLDSELRSVQGSMQLFNPDRLEVEEHAVATLRTDSGLQALVETSWIGPFDYNGHIEEFWVYGRRGTVKAFGNLRFELPGVHLWSNSAREWRIMQVSTSNFARYQYKQMIDEFVRCVRSGERFRPDANDGLRSIAAVVAFYQAADSHRAVALPLAQEPDVDAILTRLHANALAGDRGPNNDGRTWGCFR